MSAPFTKTENSKGRTYNKDDEFCRKFIDFDMFFAERNFDVFGTQEMAIH